MSGIDNNRYEIGDWSVDVENGSMTHRHEHLLAALQSRENLPIYTWHSVTIGGNDENSVFAVCWDCSDRCPEAVHDKLYAAYRLFNLRKEPKSTTVTTIRELRTTEEG